MFENDSIDWLHQEFAQRKAKQGSYSLRRFAKDLGVSSGVLSELLSYKRNLSQRQASKIVGRLSMSQEQKEKILLALESKKISEQTRGTLKSYMSFNARRQGLPGANIPSSIATTLEINSSQLELAGKLIADLQQALLETSRVGDAARDLYQLSIVLLPVAPEKK